MIIDPRLEMDSTFIMDLELSQVRLNHNAAFPWILLIPNKTEVIEIIDLDEPDQHILMHEITQTCKAMKTIFNPTKLNVAALGNVVPQLHVHIVARFKSDKAWPLPIWNSGINELYRPNDLRDRVNLIKTELLKH